MSRGGGGVDATATTTRLLDLLMDSGGEGQPAWYAMDARYRPVIKGLARRMGLSEDGAEEVAQQALTEFVRSYRGGKYDRNKGRLSSWIISIPHHAALNALRSRRRSGARGGGEGGAGGAGGADFGGGELDGVASPESDQVRLWWEQERDAAILARAVRELRESSGVEERTLVAFELVALRGVPAGEAARQCGMSVEQVYVAKSRMTARLRDIVKAQTAAFEEDA